MKKFKINDVCLTSSNIKWKNVEEDKQFIYVDLTSVDRNSNSIIDPQIITAKTAPSRAQRIIQTDDIIFATTRPTLRRVCIVPLEYDEQICSTGFCILKPNKGIVLPQYLFRMLMSNEFYEYIEPLQAGATYPAVTDKDVRSFEIPVPPLPEQQRIVEFLDTEFAKIDALKANAEKNLQHAKDLFQAALREELQPKEGWVTKELRDIADFFNGKAHEQCIDEDGKYILVNSKFISSDTKKAKRTNSQLFPLYEGDIVMVMSDVPNGKALAKCIIIPEDNVYSLNQRICAFRSSRINVRFLYYLINRNPYLLSFDNGENQTNLRKNDILKMKLSYPVNTDEISEILERLDRILPRINSLILNIEKTIVECEALKQALLRKAFSGEL